VCYQNIQVFGFKLEFTTYNLNNSSTCILVRMGPKTVMVFGTFDLLHQGHLDFFRQAKEFGDSLMVVVGRDKTIMHRKGRFPDQSEDIRLQKVSQVHEVDKAILGNPSRTHKDQIKVIEKYKPEIVCLGYDQKPDAETLRNLLAIRGLKNIKIHTLKPFYPEVYKSSKLRAQ